MILKSYFDGGNQADSASYDVVTLAALSGTKDQWKPFEGRWGAALKSNDADWLHTTDAISLTGPFSRKKGWDEYRRDRFITDCVAVIEATVALPKKRNFPGRLGIYPFTVTVVLRDHQKARSEKIDVPRNATEICATQALYACLEWGSNIMGAHFYYLFFDQGEPFRGHVCDRQRNKRARKALPLLDRVVSIAEANMRYVPALQAADLFAWCISHKNKKPRYKWQNRLLNLHSQDEWLDYDHLIRPIPKTVELVSAWKLPRRKPNR